jgi:hypothetical protein
MRLLLHTCYTAHQANARVATSAQSTGELAANLDSPASRQRAGCQCLQRHSIMGSYAYMFELGASVSFKMLLYC